MKGRRQFQVFRPERLVHESPRCAYDERRATLPLITKRLKPVSPAERRKQASLPLIGHRELCLRKRLRFDRRVKRLPDSFDRRSSSLPFASGRSALEQGGDLAQL